MSPETSSRTRSFALRLASVLVAALLASGAAPALAAEDEPPEPRRLNDGTWELEVLSPVYHVDREYRSMTGPSNTTTVRLGYRPELVWVLGYRAEMAGADGTTPAPQEFMCHSNLDFDPGRHQIVLGGSESLTGRLFTLSQGQMDIAFPPGFGMPLLASEHLELTTQVLNLNPGGPPVDVRHRVTLRYARQQDLETPLRPLITKGVYGLQLLEGPDGLFGLSEEEAKQGTHGPGCLPGQSAATGVLYTDPQGRKFTGHWVVKPGREVNHTLVTRILDLSYDTTIHYVAVHLHPFAESLELRDLTTDETVFKSGTRHFPDRIGLAHVDSFSSVEGIPIYRDHEYEVVSVYNNVTDRDQDSMAVLNLYLLDKDFRAPGTAALDARPAGGAHPTSP